MMIKIISTDSNLKLNKQTVANLQEDDKYSFQDNKTFPLIVPRENSVRSSKVLWPYRETEWCNFSASPMKMAA